MFAPTSGPVSAYDSTDANGGYSLTVVAGTYQIEASKTGYAGPPQQTVTVPPSQPNVDFTFPQRYTISGSCATTTARPCKDAQVRTYSGPTSASDSTDANGSYSLTVVAGTYQVEVSKTGYPSPPQQTVTVPPSRANLDFAFPRRYAVTGVVLDHQQHAVGGRNSAQRATRPPGDHGQQRALHVAVARRLLLSERFPG